MSLTGINNLSYLTYGAIGLTGIILAVATAYDRAEGEGPIPEAAPLFTEPIVPNMPELPAMPSFSSESSSEKGPLSSMLGSNDTKEETSVLPNVFESNEPKKEEGALAFGGKKKKRRTKKSKKSKAEKKHRKTKQAKPKH